MNELYPLFLVFLGFLALVVVPYALLYGVIAVCLRMLGIKPAPPMRGAFPVQPIEDGAGRYRVFGVERETEKDQKIVIEAESRDNARVKAELRGIVVTRIEKILQNV
jgi:hypothetical protein